MGGEQQHQTAGDVHVAGGAAPGASLSDDGNHWWDGAQWQPIDWSLAHHIHGAESSTRWGAFGEDWQRLYHAAVAGLTSNSAYQHRHDAMAEAAAEVADAAMHFMHVHGEALRAADDDAGGMANTEANDFQAAMVYNWFDHFLNAVTSKSQSGSHFESMAREAALDADSAMTNESGATSYMLGLYHSHLQY